jgi:hypothetical protein
MDFPAHQRNADMMKIFENHKAEIAAVRRELVCPPPFSM